MNNDELILEAARILEEAEWISEAANIYPAKGVKNKNFRFYIRHKHELNPYGESEHRAAIKCGEKGRLSTIPLTTFKEKMNKNSTKAEKELVNIAKRFAMDNKMALLAYWNDVDEIFFYILIDYLERQNKSHDYTKESTISSPKSAEQLEKDKKTVIAFVRKRMADKADLLRFDE